MNFIILKSLIFVIKIILIQHQYDKRRGIIKNILCMHSILKLFINFVSSKHRLIYLL